MAYKHGAYGEITKRKAVAAAQADTVLVYVGTAPVHLISGYSAAGIINTPVRLRNMDEARATFGYLDDWDSYTLCEAFAEHFNNSVANSGPIYVINVLDPDTHKDTQVTLNNQDLSDGPVKISNGHNVILDTVGVTGKVKGTNFDVSYDAEEDVVIVTPITTLTATETITYYPIKVSLVTSTTIIGAVNADGTSTGLAAIKQLYTKYNAVPT